MTGAWTLSLGLPNPLRPDAAQLYWHAFGPKLGRVLGPDRRALAFLENMIRADHVLIATAQDGSLLGLAGFKTPKGSFAMGNPQALRQFYGPWGGLWRKLLLGLLSGEVDNDNFLIDGICVAPQARGQGIGTALLHALCDQAQARGYSSSTKIWRGISPIAESVTSSLIPCSRKRDNILSRVRCEVMPMPEVFLITLFHPVF